MFSTAGTDPQRESADGDGDNGNVDFAAPTRQGTRKQISVREFHTYRLQVRPLVDSSYNPLVDNDGNVLLDNALNRAGRLFQEYCCMALAKAEAQRLRWHRKNQKTIRAELYRNLSDSWTAHDHTGGERLAAGKRVVLASSFTGGPRDQWGRYQDAMAIVRKIGKPSFFITMTCNPMWIEIQRELLPGVLPQDRPDVTVRVFRLKLAQLLQELYEDGIFGRVVARLHVIEFQHRGLPHAHIIIIVAEEDRPKTVDDIDACVSAELPPKPSRSAFPHGEVGERQYCDALAEHVELCELLCQLMIHGPCGRENPTAPCMEDGKCKKNYPKSYARETTYSDQQIYPIYRRRSPEDGGTKYTYQGRTITNAWVVPHSPRLLKKYKCHLNVEICFSVGGVKYLYKYVYKGPDRAMMAVREPGADTNEIDLYQDFRSIGSAEGCWRTFDFDMYDRKPVVVRLQVHLPDMQRCTWEEGHEQEAVEAGPPATTLTAWLDYIREHPEARTPKMENNAVVWSAKYPDFPELYTFNKKVWTPLQRFAATKTIGRVYNVHPSAGQSFYLRLLLHHVPGCELELTADGIAPSQRNADQFTLEAFKYVGAVKHETFHAACSARKLLQDDGEWYDVLNIARDEQMPRGVRELFVYIAIFNAPERPAALFEEFHVCMAEDYQREFNVSNVPYDSATLRARVLLDLDERLGSLGKTLGELQIEFSDEERLIAERAARAVARSHEPKEIRDELIPEGEREALSASAAAQLATLLPSQLAVYNAVMQAILEGRSQLIFVDAPGGTGKTYTFNTILDAVRARGDIALAVASSGIAAILLGRGRTFHSRFKAPRHACEGCTLNIAAQTNLASLLRRAKVILWDEAAMANRYHLEALDLALQDFMGNKLPFGGKVIVLGGDFRQTLPIVKRGSRAQTLEVALTNSALWDKFQKFRLTENMRVRKAIADGGDATTLQRFADWLLPIGNGTDPTTDELHTIKLPDEVCLDEGCDLDALVDWVYPELAINCGDSKWLSQRAILTPLNETVNEINSKLGERFPGEAWDCYSADAVKKTDDAYAAPTELLNSFNDVEGLPQHKISFKKNMPIMLLRNLAPMVRSALTTPSILPQSHGLH